MSPFPTAFITFWFLIAIVIHVAVEASSESSPNDDGGAQQQHHQEERNDLYAQLLNETNKLPDMWELLNCTTIQEATAQLPIHNESTWAFLRGTFIGVVGYNESDLTHDNLYGNGFGQGNIEVKHHPIKGRAVYTKRRYKAGEVVYDTEGFSACFTSGILYRKFLACIPPNLACDVLLWAYSGKSYGVCVDLDEGSFINHASKTGEARLEMSTGDERPNLIDGGTASRDIAQGEELLTDYSDFAEVDGWEHLNLGNWEDGWEKYYDDDEFEENEL